MPKVHTDPPNATKLTTRSTPVDQQQQMTCHLAKFWSVARYM